MKPTKVRFMQLLNKQICAPISNDLRKKYSRRSARIMLDDTVKVIRGEYKGIAGKVSKISTETNSIAIEGNKKEKLKGDKIDVYIHVTNVIITSLNTEDKWRLKILEKKPKSNIKSMKEAAKKKEDKKGESKKKEAKKEESKKKEAKKEDTLKPVDKKKNGDK